MNDKPVESQSPVPAVPSKGHGDLVSLILIVLLISFGMTLLLFSTLYVRDLQMLRNLPGMLWDFICGIPVESGATLPALVLFSTLSFASAAAVWGWRRLRHR
jgi:hypothetical protein